MPERPLPAYTVRVSARARRARLTVSPRDGLVVVIPTGFPQARVEGIVRRHAEWAVRALERTAEHRAHAAAAASADVPDVVELPGIGVVWRVCVRPGVGPGVRARVDGGDLVLSGGVDDRDACLAALRRAVTRAAHERLPLMLGGIEAETGWSATRVTVRRQRTRWGSCTAASAVSLNESLAFLPPRLVRHVLVHELAHTKRMDHSPQFWALVEAHDAAWRAYRRELKGAWRHVPPWALPVESD